MKFIKDLDWRTAFKRAAVFTAIWLALVYFLSQAFPGSFELGEGSDLLPLAINAVFFFFLYAVLAAFLERRRARKMRKSEAKKQDGPGKSAQDSGEDDEESAGSLKGRYNPNTSRKKARRKRQSLRR